MVMEVVRESWLNRKWLLDKLCKIVFFGTLTKNRALSYLIIDSHALHLQEVSDRDVTILTVWTVPILGFLDDHDISLDVADLPADVSRSYKEPDLPGFEQIFK